MSRPLEPLRQPFDKKDKSSIVSTLKNSLVIFGDQFTRGEQVTLVIKEKFWSTTGGSNFDILDINNVLFFKIDSKNYPFLGRRMVISDSQDEEILQMQSHFCSFRKKSSLVVNGKKVATMSAASELSICPNILYISIDLASGDVLTLDADFSQKNLTIFYKNEVIADASRDFITAQSVVTGQPVYSVTVSPGVDIALIVSIVLYFDDIFSKANGW